MSSRPCPGRCRCRRGRTALRSQAPRPRVRLAPLRAHGALLLASGSPVPGRRCCRRHDGHAASAHAVPPVQATLGRTNDTSILPHGRVYLPHPFHIREKHRSAASVGPWPPSCLLPRVDHCDLSLVEPGQALGPRGACAPSGRTVAAAEPSAAGIGHRPTLSWFFF
jgi:hypothetical protein